MVGRNKTGEFTEEALAGNTRGVGEEATEWLGKEEEKRGCWLVE